MYNQKLLSLARRHALVSKRLSYSCDILNALVFRALTREKPLNTPAIQLQTRLINALHAQQALLFNQMLQA